MSSLAEPVRECEPANGHFRAVFDVLPTAVYITDAQGYVTYYNAAAAALAGRTPRIGQDKWCVCWKLRRADGSDLPLDQCPMAVTLKEGRPVRDVAVIAVRPDGAQAMLMPFPTLLRDAGGKITGAVNTLVDVTQLKALEANSANRAEEQASLFRFTDLLYRAGDMEAIYDAALDAIFASLRCNRAAILRYDDSDVMRFVASRGLSSAYREAVTGHSPWQAGERDALPITVSDFDASDETDSLKATLRAEGIRAVAFIPLITNGGVIGKFMVYHDKPHTFTEAELLNALTIARQLGFAIERQRARDYQTDAENVRHLLSAIVANSDDAIISKDLNGVINSWNQGAERLFGYAPAEIIGRSVLTLIPPEHQHEEPGIIERIRSGERIEHYETVRRRKDGSEVYVSLTVSPVRDATGNIIGASKIARDISERRRADEQRTLLINELNHRVKNTLATVQSLAMQTLRSTERSEEARELFESRLSALSRAHDLLTQQSWAGANLYDVAERALAPFRVNPERISVGGPHVRLSPQKALALSIALHELATNATKYGALSNETGRVRLEWTASAEHLLLTWTESGGPPVTPARRSGFGTRLIQRGLSQELGGEARIDFHPEGVRAAIRSALETLSGG